MTCRSRQFDRIKKSNDLFRELISQKIWERITGRGRQFDRIKKRNELFRELVRQ
jgi:hypothetical protein